MNYFNYLLSVKDGYNNEEACLLSAICFLKKIPLVYMRSLEITPNNSYLDLREEFIRVGEKMDVSVRFSAQWFNEIPYRKHPMILKVVNPRTLGIYYLTVFDFKDGAFITGDTLDGLVKYFTPQELAYIWVSKECFFVSLKSSDMMEIGV